MINYITLARPYAKALFSLALLQKTISEWETRLARFSLLIQDKAAKIILDDPNISHEKKVDFILSFDGEELASQKMQTEIINFIRILVSKHHLGILPEITIFFKKMSLDYVGILPAKVVLAFAASEEQLLRIQTVLEKKFKRKVKLEVSIDPELVGGAVMCVGDKVIDGSIKGKLKKLRDDFKLE